MFRLKNGHCKFMLAAIWMGRMARRDTNNNKVLATWWPDESLDHPAQINFKDAPPADSPEAEAVAEL
jgi:hypothetical protein